MVFLAVAVLVFVFAWFVRALVRSRGRGIVAQRGTSIGADVAALGDRARVRIRAVDRVDSDRVTVRFVPEVEEAPELAVTVHLSDEEYGFELLHQWKRDATVLGIVMPPETRILRLRSLDELQPLTLRRVDD